MAEATSDQIVVGRIGKARGVKGHACVMPFTDDPEVRFAVGSVLQTEPAAAGPLTVSSMSDASGKLVLSFDGIESREAIEALRGVSIVMARSDRPALEDEDDFYTDELIGLAVRTVAGDELVPIADVIEIAGSDYLVLQFETGEKLVPFVKAIVPTVDIAGRFVVIDPPEGLFEL